MSVEKELLHNHHSLVYRTALLFNLQLLNHNLQVEAFLFCALIYSQTIMLKIMESHIRNKDTVPIQSYRL